MMYLSCILGSLGTSIITNVLLEMYWQRRQADKIFLFDGGLE